jgi:hypothetical protein
MFEVKIRYFAAAAAVMVVGGTAIYAFLPPPPSHLDTTRLEELTIQPSAPPPPSRAQLVYPYPLVPAPPPQLRAVPSIYGAVREAMVAAGVDEEKVDGPAADLSAAIGNSIRTPIDELWLYGKIAAGSLVPLWIIALVALFRHQRERVDLSHLEHIIRQANLVAPDRDHDALAPFRSR